jgi:hypothetical protein
MNDIREWIEGCGDAHIFEDIGGGTYMYEMESEDFMFTGAGSTEAEALHDLFLSIREALLQQCEEVEEDNRFRIKPR